jgi:hypothetical protein
VDPNLVEGSDNIMFCGLSGEMDHQDRPGVETAMAGSFFFSTPLRRWLPHGHAQRVVGADDYSRLCGESGRIQGPHQLPQAMVGKRQIIDIGTGGALVPRSAVVDAGRVRYRQMNEHQANAFVTDQRCDMTAARSAACFSSCGEPGLSCQLRTISMNGAMAFLSAD